MNECNEHSCGPEESVCSFRGPDFRLFEFCGRRRPPLDRCDEEAVLFRLSSTPASVPASRRYAREFLAARSVVPSVSETLELVVSELVTNAVQHSGTRQRVRGSSRPGYFELGMYVRAKHVRVEVQDDEDRLPVLLNTHDYAESGRGIGIIQLCARRWGTHRLCTGGKVVWCDVGLSGSSSGRAMSASGHARTGADVGRGTSHVHPCLTDAGPAAG